MLPAIKICGITDSATATKAAQLGAHYIGLVFHQTSSRYVEMQNAKTIAQAVKKQGAIPVAVVTTHTADEIITLCNETDINLVQLHGETSRQAICSITPHLQCIYAITINHVGQLSFNPNHLEYINPDKDFLLFDGSMPGSGKTVAYQAAKKLLQTFRCLLAGGLHASNVRELIECHQPYAVDVSTHVEQQPGKKSIEKIRHFIHEVHNAC